MRPDRASMLARAVKLLLVLSLPEVAHANWIRPGREKATVEYLFLDTSLTYAGAAESCQRYTAEVATPLSPAVRLYPCPPIRCTEPDPAGFNRF